MLNFLSHSGFHYSCMERLSGKWEFSRQPIPDGQLKNLHLTTDAGGRVTGSATLTIEGNIINYRVSGVYNGAALEFHTNSDTGDYNFTFSGNCQGGYIFE
jgi:hypothetical protein